VDVGITVTGGIAGAITIDPSEIFAGVQKGASIPSENVEVTNDGTTVNVRFETVILNRSGGGGSIAPGNYIISPSFINIASGNSASFLVDLNVPAATPVGDYFGPVRFYRDANNNSTLDGGEDSIDYGVNVEVAPVIDHIRMTADTLSSSMGSPIFVTLTAEDIGNNKIDGFMLDVTVDVKEVAPIGVIPQSWILSTNDGPQGADTSVVEIFGGVGNFTVDSLEPETLKINVIGGHTVVGGPLNLQFLPNAMGSGAVGFAIIGPNRVPTTGPGTNVWVAAIDGNGQVVTTGYNQLVDFTITVGSAAVTPANHTFMTADNGQFQVSISDGTAEMVTLKAQESPSGFSKTFDIDFVGVDHYEVFGPDNSTGLTFAKQGLAMPFTLRAADSSNNIIRSYNKTANFVTGDANAFLSDGSPIQFVDGIAEIILNNNVNPDTIIFDIQEVGAPGIASGNITANFEATDSDAPEIVRVEMDTPWIVHIYFNEDVDSVTAGVEGNYTGVFRAVDKVCWYGDNVTLNLSGVLPTDLGSTFSVTINGVQDTTGNAMVSVSSSTITVPDVDFQGSSGDTTNDWFEVQVSKSNPAAGETVHVTIYHKNICGYLTGDNNQNKNSSVGTVNIVYSGTTLILNGSQPGTADLSSGRAEFDITVAASPPTGSFTISANGGSPNVTTSTTATVMFP